MIVSSKHILHVLSSEDSVMLLIRSQDAKCAFLLIWCCLFSLSLSAINTDQSTADYVLIEQKLSLTYIPATQQHKTTSPVVRKWFASPKCDPVVGCR